MMRCEAMNEEVQGFNGFSNTWITVHWGFWESLLSAGKSGWILALKGPILYTQRDYLASTIYHSWVIEN